MSTESLRRAGISLLLTTFIVNLGGCNRLWEATDEDVPLPIGPANQSSTTDAGESVFDGISFVVIGPLKTEIGSPTDEVGRNSDELLRRVDLPRYGISTTEITESQYWQVIDDSKDTGSQLPVRNVTWDEAVEFCRELSARHLGATFRLPTEAEWEAACRAGSNAMFSIWKPGVSQSESVAAWRRGDTRQLERHAQAVMRFDSSGPSAVASFPPNAWGITDCHGNVWEWCAQGPSDLDDAPTLRHRPIRGGSWVSSSSLDCRAARRAWQRKDSGTAAIGFRVVMDMP